MEEPKTEPRWIIPLILAAHLGLVIWLSVVLNVWVDENYTMETTEGSLRSTISRSISFEGQPPLYFMFVWLWRQASDSIVWLRASSWVFVVAFLIVVARIFKRLFPDIHPGWVLVLVAFNPITIAAGSEMRATSMTMFMSAVLVLLFIDGFLTETPRKTTVVLYGIVSVLALYTHYYLGFLLFANGIALLVTRRPRRIIAYYTTMAVVALAIAPMAVALQSQVSMHMHHELTEHGSYFKGVRYMIERVQKLIWPTIGVGLPGKWRWLLPGMFAASLATGLYLRRGRLSQTARVFVLATGVGMLVFAVAVWKMGWELMAARHVVPLIVPGYVSVYAVIHLFDGARRRQLLAAWTVLAAGFGTYALYETQKPLAKAGDWKRVANYIETYEKPNEPILVFPAMGLGPLDTHYNGINQLIALPRREDYESYNTEEHVLKNAAEIEAALDRRAPNRGDTIWVAINCDAKNCGWLGLQYNLPVLEDYLRENYSVVSETDYYGTKLQHLSVKNHPAAVPQADSKG